MDGEPPPLTLRALLEDAPPLPGRAEQPPPSGSAEPVILLCCGRAFLSQRSLDLHRAAECGGDVDNVERLDQPDLTEGGFFGRERTEGMGESPLREQNLQIERLKENEESNSTLFRMDRAPRVNRNVEFIRRLNSKADDTDDDDEDDDLGSPPASPSQVKSKSQATSSNASLSAQPQRQYPCPYCRASYARYDFLTSHMTVWHAGQPHDTFPTPTQPNDNDVNVNNGDSDEEEVDVNEEAFDPEDDDDGGSEGSDEFPCPVKGCVFKSSLKVPGSLATHMDVAHRNAGQFKCSLCPSSFRFAILLKKHKLVVHPTSSQTVPLRKTKKKTHKCPKCDYVAVKDHIKRHLRTAHSKDGAFTCPQCPCAFDNKRKLSIHTAVHQRKEKLAQALREQNVSQGRSEEEEAEQLSCSRPRCAYKTQWTHMMDHHVTTAHVDGGLPCEFCSCTFADDLPRVLHVASAHPRENETARSIAPLRWNMKKPPLLRSQVFSRMRGGKVWACPRCPYSSTNSVNFRFHSQVCARRDDQQAPPLPPPPHSSSTAQRSKKRKRQRAYTSCPLCGSRHEGVRHLAAHVERCHVEGGVQCPSCPCTFKSETSMGLHNTSVHGRKKAPPTSSQCSKCPFIGLNQRHLEEHLKRSHVEGGLPCDLCPCTFLTSVGLESHVGSVHVGGEAGPSASTDPPPETPENVGGRPRKYKKRKKGLLSNICALCGFKTTSKDIRAGIADHRKTSHVEGGVPCGECPCSFAHKRSLKRHVFLAHRNHAHLKKKKKNGGAAPPKERTPPPTGAEVGGAMFKCSRCPYSTTMALSFGRHVERCHVEGGFPCPHCPTHFTTQRSVNAHVLKVHQSEPGPSTSVAPPPLRPGQCPHCAKECPTASTLAQHINSAHPIKKKIAVATPTAEEKREEPKEEEPRKVKVVLGGGVLRCGNEGCSFLTLLPSSMEKHFASCKATPTHQEEEEEEPMEEEEEEEELIQCSKCDQKFSAAKDLDSHLLKAHVPGGFACRWCPRSYRTKPILAVHISKAHGQRGVSRTSLEKYAKSARRQFTRQLSSTSVNVKDTASFRLRCSQCPLRFTSTWEYSTHKKRAHVEGGAKCPLCPCAFASRSGREAHLDLVHRHSPLKIYNCPKCTWSTAHSQKTFDAHMKAAHVKGGVQCGECPCAYRNAGSLTQHYSQRHPHKTPPIAPSRAPPTTSSPPEEGEEEEPRKKRKVGRKKKKKVSVGWCEVCGEDFHRLIFLTRHQKSAHVEGGECCPHCPRTYKTPSGVAFHIRVKHANEEDRSPTPDPPQVKGHREEEEKEGKLPCVLCSPRVYLSSFDALNAHLLLLHNPTPSNDQPPPTEEEDEDVDVEEEEPVEIGRRTSTRLLGKVKPNMFNEDVDEDEEEEEEVDEDEVDVEEEEERPPSRRSLRRRTSTVDAKAEDKEEEKPTSTKEKPEREVNVKTSKDVVKVSLEEECGICEWRGESVARHEETCHVREARAASLKKGRRLLSTLHECPLCAFSFSTKFALDVHLARAKTHANVHFQRRQRPLETSKDAVELPPSTEAAFVAPLEEKETFEQEEEVARELEEMAESWKKDGAATPTAPAADSAKPPTKDVEAPPKIQNKPIESLKAPQPPVRKLSPSQRPLRCLHCKGLFLGPAALKTHISVVHDTSDVVSSGEETSSRFRCGVCPLIFRTHVELTCHAIRSDHAMRHSSASPAHNVSPADSDATKTSTSNETQTEPRKRGRPRKHPKVDPVPLVPVASSRGRGRPVGSTWLLNWQKKIDDNWRLAEASSKASTQWTFDKTTAEVPSEDDDQEERKSVSSSSVTSEESVDVTKPPRNKPQLQTDVDVENIDIIDLEELPAKPTNQRKLSFTEMSTARRLSATSSTSTQRPLSTNQSPKVSTSARAGRPLRKSAESAASFISRIVADEQTVDTENHQTPSTSTKSTSPVAVADSTSAFDEVVEIPANEESVVLQEPDSTTPAAPPNRRGDWLKEFMRVMCSRCSTPFESSFLLAKHFHVCSATCDSFLCSLCDPPRSYPSLQRLKEHIWTSHKPPSFVETTQAVYSCALCKQELRDRKTFIFHCSVPHLLRCRKCSFTCNTRAAMDAHKDSNLHGKKKKNATTPPKPPSLPLPPPTPPTRSHRCNCGAKFSRFSDFKAHTQVCRVRQHKQKREESKKEAESKREAESKEEKREESESLVCEVCAYVSADIRDAREHANAVASNESRICDLCGFIAASQCELILHSRKGCGTGGGGGGAEVPAAAEEAKEEEETEEGPSQCVQPISLNSDQLMMSLEDLGEEPVILFDLSEVAAASATTPT